MVMCHLTVEGDLARAAATCRALHRAVAGAVSAGGCWHSLCAARWPDMTEALRAADEDLRGLATSAMGTLPGEGESTGWGGEIGARTLALDWHVLLRERERHRAAWEAGSSTLSLIGGQSGSKPAHRGPVYGCKLAGDDRLLTSSEDATLMLWDLATNEPLKTCEGHDHGILGAWVNDEASTAVSGGFDSTIRVWDLRGESPKAKCSRVFAGRKRPPRGRAPFPRIVAPRHALPERPRPPVRRPPPACSAHRARPPPSAPPRAQMPGRLSPSSAPTSSSSPRRLTARAGCGSGAARPCAPSRRTAATPRASRCCRRSRSYSRAATTA